MREKSFHIYKNNKAIIYLQSKDKRLSKVIDKIGEIDCHIHDNGYEFLVGEIVGQMLSNKVSDKIFERLTELCHGKVSVEEISKLTVSEMRGTGMSRAKVQYIKNFTNAVKNEQIVFEEMKSKSDQEVMNILMSIKGIGSWTSKMYLLFVLERPDILPFEDGAFLQSYQWLYETDDVRSSSIIERCKVWKPYSSTAARYLYRALDMGIVKIPISTLID